MKRSDFLKILAVVIAAPASLIKDDRPYQEEENPRQRRAVAWKITENHAADIGYMTWLLQHPTSDLWVKARERGIDMTEPHQVQIGFDADDFTRGLQTIIISQPVKEAA